MDRKKPVIKNSDIKEHASVVDVTKKRNFKITKKSIIEFFTTKPTKRRVAITGSVSIGVLLFSLLVINVYRQLRPVPILEPIIVNQEEPEPIKPVTVASKLTGEQVLPELNKRPITGIMIENSIDARPQSGLVDAGVVFEAIAEGGITRFLALYQINQPEYIGPIRSARPYYVLWAAGFDAAYVHSGGSGEALNFIRWYEVNDMDHATNPSYFDRVSNRYNPHNVYTSMARLDSLRAEKGYTTSTFDAFARIPEKVAEDETVATEPSTPATAKVKATKIDFNISGPLYNTSYTYNADNNNYARNMAGQPHLDEKTGKPIKPSVVIALITSFGEHPDGIHNTYTVVGSGTIKVFQNGEVIEGKWSKANERASLKFTTNSGAPLELQPGMTWVTAIPNGRVSFTP